MKFVLTFNDIITMAMLTTAIIWIIIEFIKLCVEEIKEKRRNKK